MSQSLPNMLDSTIAKIREMVDANSVVGEPIVINDGVITESGNHDELMAQKGFYSTLYNSQFD